MTTPKPARLTVCVGGGGVGKTTSSAALGLHFARSGSRTLVITVDPARRLADALGVELGQATRPAPIDDRAQNRLFARMPDPRLSMDDFTLWLFTDEQRRERFRNNRAVQEMADSIAGIHEILTVALLQNEVDSGNYDEVVLDTAPSRHALAFLTYPTRLLDLLEAKALTWLASAAENSDPDEENAAGDRGAAGAIFAWGKARLESLFGRVIGLPGLRSLSSMFADLATVRERWAALARRTQTMLEDPSTRYYLVGAPSGGALDDIVYLSHSLERRNLRPTAVVLNRAEQEPPACEQQVRALLDSKPGLVSDDDARVLRQTLDALAAEHAARKSAADEASKALAKRLPRNTPLLRLPFVGPAGPRDIVLALADEWAKHKPLAMSLTVYHYGGCSTCKKALAWLKARKAPFEAIDLVAAPPSAAEIERLWRASGRPLSAFFNTSGQSYRAGNFKERLPSMTDAQKLEALAADGKLIKRPIAVRQGPGAAVAVVGFDEKSYAALLA